MRFRFQRFLRILTQQIDQNRYPDKNMQAGLLIPPSQCDNSVSPIHVNKFMKLSPASNSALLFKAIVVASCVCTINPCFAAGREVETSLSLLVIIACLLIIQTILIAGLQRSRIKNKAAKNLLKSHQKELEQKIHDRTQSLHQKNNELENAIQSHKTIAVQLQDTKRHLQTMINSVPDILVGVDADGKVTYWNIAAFERTGLSFDKALGTHIITALPQLPLSEDQLEEIIKHQQPFINRQLQQIENDEPRFYDLRIYPLISGQASSGQTSGAVIQLKDVTKRVQLENMMIQNEKMSSLGELAAGIAHEINNPLGIILHNVQNIIRRTSSELDSNIETAKKHHLDFAAFNSYLSEREVPQFLENIKEAGERAGKIVSNMLEFSHSNHNEKNWVSIPTLIEQAIEFNRNAGFAEQSKMADINVITRFDKDFPSILASAAELQQVFLNLLRNSYQALTSDDYKHPDELRVEISVYSKKSDIFIEISDNGPGIKDAIKDHIFEPFFTTKEVGKGTGLGLSVSYFIITEHHKGKISVSSQYGKGATFKIRLPIMGDRQFSLDI
ncbi:MAG: PAS domain S-box protein [Chitinophagaceae bacterium]|nr:MAG: PAS domain S-box protein [Chitinophagaceae bacterium]